MIKYIVQRLIMMVFVIIGITIILFIAMYLIPGDPAKTVAGPLAAPEQVEAIRVKFGLDKPLLVQYFTYIKNLFTGNLGVSILTRKPVSDELRVYLPATLELVFAALLMVILLAVPLGVLSALKPGRLADILSRFLTALGMGMPVFWTGLMVQFIFYGKLSIIPFGGRLPTGMIPPEYITGFYTIDALLVGNIETFKSALSHLITPAFILALPELAVISRLTQSSMLDVFRQEYMRTAIAKGISKWRVVMVHALKNALLAPLTMFGIQIGSLLGNTILVESIFSWGGLGYFVSSGIAAHDFPIIMGTTLVIILSYAFSNLIVDILYSWLDPRIVRGQ